MKVFTYCLSVFLLILIYVGSVILVREDGFNAGKAAKMIELSNVFAPHGYEKIKGAKQDCEIKSNETCRIYGGFAPKSMFMQPQVPELKRQKL